MAPVPAGRRSPRRVLPRAVRTGVPLALAGWLMLTTTMFGGVAHGDPTTTSHDDPRTPSPLPSPSASVSTTLQGTLRIEERADHF